MKVLKMAKILIIDDDEDISGMVSLRLSLRGHSIHSQLNGQDGIKDALKTKPDLILLDMQMPQMKGEQVADLLRTKGYDGCIVLLSAAPIPNHLHHILDIQCDGYIAKPVERNFEDQIEKYLETSHV